jgi:hypothetical protein
MAPGSRVVLRRADREAGDGADDDPEQDVDEPSPDATPRPAPRATHACTARWLDDVGCCPPAMSVAPFLLPHAHGGAPLTPQSGCRSLSGRLASGNAAATGVRSWRDASQPAATEISGDPIAAGLVLTRDWVGWRYRPPMAQPLVATPPATVRCQGLARLASRCLQRCSSLPHRAALASTASRPGRRAGARQRGSGSGSGRQG